MTQLIRSKGGDTLKITKDKLIEVSKNEDDDSKFWTYLHELGSENRMFYAYPVDQVGSAYLTMNWADRQIGCCEFDEKNWAILTRAIKAALKG